MQKQFHINLDEKTKVVITTTAIVAVTFFICLGIMKHQIKKSHDIRTKIVQESKKIALRNDIAKIQVKQDEYIKYFYDTADQKNFRLIIFGLAKASGVEIVSIQPFGRKGIASISKNFLKISVRCTYSQLVEFIAEIEALTEIIKLEELSVADLSDMKGYIAGDEDKKKEFMGSDTRTTVSLIVAAYSTKH